MSAAEPWTADLPPGRLDAATELLRDVADRGATVVLAAHVAPDGDSLGAALALHAVLGQLGADTRPTVGEEPLRLPAALAGLPRVEDLVPAHRLPPSAEVSLLVGLDAASPERLGSVAGLVDAGVPTLVVDHHERHVPFGDVRLVAPRAAATVVLVEELIRRLGVPLDPDVATCLYVGLVTDTGRFGHPSTDRAAMELGGRLLAAGVDHAAVTRDLFGTHSLAELRLLGRALERATLVAGLGLVHTHVTPEDLAATGAGPEEAEIIVDLVRTVDVADVAVVARPGRDGSWQVSLRSDGDVDVGAAAEALGGGGHARAAGFTGYGDVARVLDEALATVAASRDADGDRPDLRRGA